MVLQEWVPSSCPMGSGDRTLDIRHGSKYLYSLSHLTRSFIENILQVILLLIFAIQYNNLLQVYNI